MTGGSATAKSEMENIVTGARDVIYVPIKKASNYTGLIILILLILVILGVAYWFLNKTICGWFLPGIVIPAYYLSYSHKKKADNLSSDEDEVMSK